MIAATVIARNPKKFGFGNVPYQPPLTPHSEPTIAVAQVVSPVPVLRQPVQSSKPPKVHLASIPGPQPRPAGTSRQKAIMPAKAPQKPGNRKVCGIDRKSPGKQVTHTKSTPYVASLFGYPHSGPKKTEARKNKSIFSSSSRAYAKPKKPKPSPALLAGKPKSKPTRLAVQKGGHKAKLSKSGAKGKSKTLLVSQAR
jgi:hypothetical protein